MPLVHISSRFLLPRFGFALVLPALSPVGVGQIVQPTPPQTAAPPADTTAPQTTLPPGQVIIQSHGEPPALPTSEGDPQGNANAARTANQPIADQATKADLTDADRNALLITAYNLDVHLRPVDSGLSARALLTVQNVHETPLKQIALQISSSLHWESASLLTASARLPLTVAQHRLDTDADHTGAENELILTLPEPLAPQASLQLDLFYSGTIPVDAARLQRLGATAAQQTSTDWDAVSTSWTGLRGFGNVLWYPVASSQLFLAEGNSLFQAVGDTRLREEAAAVRLRLGVDYQGAPPVAAYFCGRREPLTAITDNPDSPTETGTGVATATFGSQPLGFRTLSLFLLQTPEVFADPPGQDVGNAALPAASPTLPGNPASPSSPASPASGSSSSLSQAEASDSDSSTPPPLLRRAGALDPGSKTMLAVQAASPGTARQFAEAAYRSSTLLRQWLGPAPVSALTALNHEGQPFQDGPLLVAPLPVLAESSAGGNLVQSLTHAWVQTGQPWMDEGLAQFFALLYTERQSGREAANAQMNELMQPVALAEPDPTAKFSPADAQPLIAASSEMIYRRKAAAVWWMLRGIVGDGNLHAALDAWCTQPVSYDPPAVQAVAFQHLLEKVSHQELGWFFNDWVLQDKGLPDLTIGDISVVAEPTGPGHPAGWLVAVTLRNEGGAVADVPLVVHSGLLSTTHRVRIPGQGTVTERLLVEAAPTSVALNDGGTPEQRLSTHTSDVRLRSQ